MSLPKGVTSPTLPPITYGPDGKPHMAGYQISVNPQGGYTVTKNNWALDYGVPLGVGGIFGYGAFGPGGYAALGGGGAPAAAPAAGGSTPLAGVGGATVTPDMAAGYGIPSGLTAASEGVNITAPEALSSIPLGSIPAMSPAGSVPTGSINSGGGGFWGGLKKLFGGGSGKGTSNLGGQLLNTGLNLTGTLIARNAASKATQQLIDAGNKELAFEQQRYADAQSNFKPYIANGQAANTDLLNYMQGPNSPINQVDRFNAPVLANAKNNGTNMVTMRAPTGETQQVPGFMQAHYTANGAKVVG